MFSVSVNIPDEVLFETKMNQEDTIKYIKKNIALNYYVNNGVSLGYCSEIADISKEEFIKYLGKNGVSLFEFDDDKEFLEELNNA